MQIEPRPFPDYLINRAFLLLRILTSVFLLVVFPATSAVAAEPPLLPFNNTGDLFVLEDECDCVLRITPEGAVSVHITRQEIWNATGMASVDFDSTGIAFGPDGTLYFSEDDSDTILMQPPGGPLSVMVSRQGLMLTLGFPAEINITTLEFGSDGTLYGVEDETDSLLSFFPPTGLVAVFRNAQDFQNQLGPGETVDIDEGLVADDKGFLYVSSGPNPPVIFKVRVWDGTVSRLTSGAPLIYPDEYGTRAPNGDLLFVDDEVSIVRITEKGEVTPFLSEAEIQAIVGPSVSLEAGLAFNSDGFLFIGEEESDAILLVTQSTEGSCAAREVEIWVSEADIMAATGEDNADLDQGIAFASAGSIPGPFLASDPSDSNTRHLCDDKNENNTCDDKNHLVARREDNVISGSKSSDLATELDCVLSNPHPLTGHYQTCYVETWDFSEVATSAFNGRGLLNWGARALLSAFCTSKPLQNTFTIEDYDANLRPTTVRVKSTLGAMEIESQILARDNNGDGISDSLELQTIFPVPLASIVSTPIDTDQDGRSDLIRLVYKEGEQVILPLTDTNGDGIPDSPALDLDNDGVPDSDLPLFPFFAGPANPTTEQKLYFAQFGDGGDENAFLFSQITLMNMDPDMPASVRVILRKDDGTPLSVDLNGEVVNGEKELTIPAGGVVILKTDGVGDLTVGSATVISDRAVAGVILFGGNVGVAGVGVSHPQKKGFIANIENNTSKQISTGLALMNLDEEAATYNLSLCDLNGQSLSTSQLTLPALGHRSLFVFQLDWDPEIDLSDFEGLLKVTSNSPVAATALQTRPGEYATLPVAPNFGATANGASPARFRASRSPLQSTASLNQKLYFPQFANGGLGGTSIFSQAILFNLTGLDANTKLVLKKASGDAFTVTLNGETVAGEKELVIPAGGLAVLESDGQGELSEGSLTVHSDQALAGVVLFVGSAQAGTAGVGSSSLLLKGFWAPMENNSADSISTGLAVMNLEEETVDLDLTLCDANGNQLATGELSIPALGQETFFPGEINWQPGQGVTLDFTNFIGLMKVSADGNTAAAVVQTRPGVFATLPVVPPLE